MEDEMPGWAKKNQALIVWRPTHLFQNLWLKEVRAIKMEGSYRDPESEVPILGEDLLNKLLEEEG